MGNVLLDKSVDFAVRCVKFYNYLRDEKREYVMSKQMLRSGTSIGANISESQGSQSNPDFIARLHISLKEAKETSYWLLVLYRSEIINETEYNSMNDDLKEIIALLVSIIKSLKVNSQYDCQIFLIFNS
jgi:four helix bundle protein